MRVCVVLIGLPLGLSCSKPCGTGRVQTPEGCVSEDVADFNACVRASGATELTQEDLKSIEAQVGSYGAEAHWQSRLKQRWDGAGDDTKWAVIEHCIRIANSSRSAPSDTVPSANELQMTSMRGTWEGKVEPRTGNDDVLVGWSFGHLVKVTAQFSPDGRCGFQWEGESSYIDLRGDCTIQRGDLVIEVRTIRTSIAEPPETYSRTLAFELLALNGEIMTLRDAEGQNYRLGLLSRAR